jgi:hypothetical protein
MLSLAKRLLPLVAASCCVALAQVSFWAPQERARAEAPSGPRSYEDVVQVRMQDRGEVLRLAVPRAYVRYVDGENATFHLGISLAVRFPSMEPADRRAKPSDPEIVIVNLRSFENSGGTYDYSKIIEHRLKTDWVFAERVNDELKIFISRRYLNKYRIPSKIIEEYIVPTSLEPPDIFFDCLRETGNKHVGCSGEFGFGRNLSLSVIFRRTELHKWRQIRAAVVELLKEFQNQAQ